MPWEVPELPFDTVTYWRRVMGAYHEGRTKQELKRQSRKG